MLNYLVVGSLLFYCYYHSLLALAIDIKLITGVLGCGCSTMEEHTPHNQRLPSRHHGYPHLGQQHLGSQVVYHPNTILLNVSQLKYSDENLGLNGMGAFAII